MNPNGLHMNDTPDKRAPDGFFDPRTKQPKIFKETRQSPMRRVMRELIRVGMQFRFIAVAPSYRLQKWQHDRNWDVRVKFSIGSRPLTPKAFVIVLFQPNGVSATTLESCATMADAGYAVVAISNCPLSDTDRSQLATVCWRYGTRPNYGYDAGAYRDALKLLETDGGKFEEVLMMNDSIMFPLGGDIRVLEDLRHLPDGFGGLVLKTKAKGERAKRPLWDDFVEAYFYRCRGPLLQPNGLFWRVWRSLWLTPGRADLKEGLVSYILAFRGYPLVTIASRRAFMDKTKAASCGFLHKTLRYGAYSDEHLAQQGAELVQDWDGKDDQAWKALAVSHIEETVNGHQFHHSFFYASYYFFGLSFVKKSKGDRPSTTIQAYLAAVDAGDLPPPTPLQRKELENPANRQAWGQI